MARPETPTSVPDPQASGRAELADWLTDETHPLTSRVIANRLWRWHFGRGLVASVDNFGLLGSTPTHPELLDHLATDLVRGDWSLKRLQRRLVTSRMYATGSAFEPRAAELDPENLTWWRVPRRRLSAEETRDSLLAVSKGLDLQMYGQLLKNPNRQYVSGTAQDRATYASLRRTIYLPILRSAVYDVLQAFDFPDPAVSNGDRATSTIAPQALFALNAELVVAASERLADEMVLSAGDDASRVARLVMATLGRPPSPDETIRSLEYLRRYRERQTEVGTTPAGLGGESGATETEKVDRAALASLARVLLATNEFAFVD